MSELFWIIGSSLLMCLIALIGSVTLLLQPATLDRLLLPLVALAAGSLVGGAFFHMLPTAIASSTDVTAVFVAVALGFTVFFMLEQLLHWHHCRRSAADCRKPLTYLILLGDALHNFIGGLAIAGTFLIDIRLGITSWLAAALHEVPQELGDFAVLIHGGWSKKRALAFNFLSALTFLLGGLVTYYASTANIDITLLVPFAAGNFLYIGAVDLIPEVNKHAETKVNIVHCVVFIVSLILLWSLTLLHE